MPGETAAKHKIAKLTNDVLRAHSDELAAARSEALFLGDNDISQSPSRLTDQNSILAESVKARIASLAVFAIAEAPQIHQIKYNSGLSDDQTAEAVLGAITLAISRPLGEKVFTRVKDEVEKLVGDGIQAELTANISTLRTIKNNDFFDSLTDHAVKVVAEGTLDAQISHFFATAKQAENGEEVVDKFSAVAEALIATTPNGFGESSRPFLREREIQDNVMWSLFTALEVTADRVDDGDGVSVIEALRSMSYSIELGHPLAVEINLGNWSHHSALTQGLEPA